MTKAVQKFTLSPSRDIPFDKLMLRQSNVQRIKAGVSVEDLAEDIARRGLMQSVSVRPVLADDGTETGKFEIPAGNRRFLALSLLVKQKQLVTEKNSRPRLRRLRLRSGSGSRSHSTYPTATVTACGPCPTTRHQ